jgi:hypothetical protein
MDSDSKLGTDVTSVVSPKWLVSSANIKWWVLKPVLMCVYFPVFESYLPRWRLALLSGNRCADGWVDPFLNTSGFSGGRTVAVIQTRPS